MLELEQRGILAIGSGLNGSQAAPTREKIQKLNKVFSLVNQFEESEEFMNALTKESLSKSIFVFTSKGEIVELPAGATAIDFAFKLDPWLGSRIWRVKVDGRFVGVDARLQSGNLVEVLPSKQIQLREKWLEIANTISAKQAIRKALQKRLKKQPVDIIVLARDRSGLVADASHIFQSEGISLLASYSVSQNRRIGVLQFNIDPLSEEKLKQVMKRLRSISGVKKVRAVR
jgi:(p)ppGpp synthase/HD superfamily hydrolase